MNALTRISLKNSVAVVILCMLVLGYGFYSATQIRQQTFPDLEFPAVFVQAVYPGASTEEVEAEITTPVENSLMAIRGYDALTSTSSENAASIVMQFPFGSDMDSFSADIEAALDKADLPERASVTVQRLSFGAAPIYQAAVFSAEGDTAALAAKLEGEVAPRLRKLEGVSSVELKGTMSEKLTIVVDKDKAAQAGITLSAIQSALQGLDFALPLGTVNVDETAIPIRLTGDLDSLEQIRSLKLAPAGSGAGGTGQGGQPGAEGAGGGSGAQAGAAGAVMLADIAEIETQTVRDEITRFNGTPSYTLEVVKTQDANTAEVADAVKEVLAPYEASGELDVHVIMDQGEAIEESVSGLVKEGLYGVLFCVLIIFLFLRNVRATLISIVSLPISIFATIALMNEMGYTLNIMTLGGIAVSIGRIVDDSIVVIENIFRWRQEKGEQLKGKELAFRATKEVMGAVSSSTIAMVVVFAPLAFVTGIIGEFFRPFSLAVVISILSSLLVATMLIPVLGSSFFRKIKPHPQASRLATQFEKVIRGALKRKALVIGLSLALLVGSLALIPALGVAFLPASSAPSVGIELKLPAQASLEQTDKVSAAVERHLESLADVDLYNSSVGGGGGNPFQGTGSRNTATVTAQLIEGADADAMIARLEAELPAIVAAVEPETALNVQAAQQEGPPSGNGIDVRLYADDPADLAEAAGQIERLMAQHGDLKNITNNMNEVTPKWVLTLNRQGIDANVSPYMIMQLVGELLRPVAAGTYAIDGDSREITLSYKQQVASREELENILVPVAGQLRPLKEIADIAEQSAWIRVNHDDGKMSAQISGTVSDPDDVSRVTSEVTSSIDGLQLPDGVEVGIGGGQEMITEGFASIGIAMAAAVGLVFLVMSMTFGGLLTPLIILCSLLFIPVGSLSALLITGQALTMSSMIGMLMLVGIVVTNAVVLLDRVEKNRLSGMPITEAIVEASKVRLRPILMTAFATMLALLPLALSGSTTSLISGGLAITVIGGLFTSTLLTLVFLPVVYELAWKKRKVREIETF